MRVKSVVIERSNLTMQSESIPEIAAEENPPPAPAAAAAAAAAWWWW
jgi:hypothetical protein